MKHLLALFLLLASASWAVVTVEKDGKELTGEKAEAFKKVKLTFKGDALTHSAAPDQVAKFKLDPEKKPAALDLEVTEPAKAVFRYLYELDGDTLRLCSWSKADERPKEFTSKGGQVVITYKREGKKEK